MSQWANFQWGWCWSVNSRPLLSRSACFVCPRLEIARFPMKWGFQPQCWCNFQTYRGGKGPQGPAGPPAAGCPGPRPGDFWRRRPHNPAGQPAWPPSQWKCASIKQKKTFLFPFCLYVQTWKSGCGCRGQEEPRGDTWGPFVLPTWDLSPQWGIHPGWVPSLPVWGRCGEGSQWSSGCDLTECNCKVLKKTHVKNLGPSRVDLQWLKMSSRPTGTMTGTDMIDTKT